MKVGDKIRFKEDKLPYTIQARNDRYIICTRRLNKRVDADLLWFEVDRYAYMTFTSAYNDLRNYPVYTIVDLKENIRGTENLVFCLGFQTVELCEESLKRLITGWSKISHRTRIPLKIITASLTTNKK